LLLLEDAPQNVVELAASTLQPLMLADRDAYVQLAGQLVQQVGALLPVALAAPARSTARAHVCDLATHRPPAPQ